METKLISQKFIKKMIYFNKYIVIVKLVKMKYIYAIVVFLLLFLSCNKNKSINNIDTIKERKVIFPDSKTIEKGAIEFLDIVDTTFIVKLETSKECLIGRPSKIQVYNNHVFILDGVTKSLFEFDFNGNFIKKFGNIGKGPGEYILPLSFSINHKKNEIVIYDRPNKKLLSYGLDGKFKASKNINIKAFNFIISNEDSQEYIFDTHIENQRNVDGLNSKQYSITKSDEEGNITSQFLETSKEQNSLGYRSRYNLFRNDSIILYNQPFTNTIYQVKKGNIEPFLTFEFKGKEIPDKTDYNINFYDFREKIEENVYEFFENNSGFFLIENKFIFRVKREGGYEDHIYNLKTNRLNLIEKNYNAPNFGFLGVKACVYKNYLVNYAFPRMYLNSEYFNSEKFINTTVQDIIKNTKEGDNPILIFNRIKS
ncbi:6-bladed beta-propeller [Mariniflexile sp. HMF6888]|uniref:6-bladed beta-propeller n=1 Tax=Mariniflexile sp. HMF6888 TaxID=3373086 RepID=UPI003796D496